MIDMIEFGYARLNEEEAAAKAVRRHPGPWVHEAHSGLLPAARDIFDDAGDPVAIANGGYLADHIVLHDPARTLRDIEGKRATIRALEIGCREVCGSDHALVREVLEQTVRNLLVRWADHPLYEEAWKP